MLMNVQTWREERSGPYQTPQVLIITVTNKGLKGTKSFNEVLELLDITISIVTKSFKQVHIANIDIITEKDTPRGKTWGPKKQNLLFFFWSSSKKISDEELKDWIFMCKKPLLNKWCFIAEIEEEGRGKRKDWNFEEELTVDFLPVVVEGKDSGKYVVIRKRHGLRRGLQH